MRNGSTRGCRSPRRLLLALGVSAAVALGAAFGLWLALDQWAWQDSVDYSKRPRAELFRSVTGRSIPAGLTELQVAGRSGPFGIKHWVWLRFRLTERAARTLTKGMEAVDSAYAQKMLQTPATPRRYVKEDERSLHWEELSQIKQPEFYMVENVLEGSSFVWNGTLILDRRRGTGFILAYGD